MPSPPNSLPSQPRAFPAAPPRIWISLLLVSLGVVWSGVLLEWLFFATKYSFMTMLSWPEKLRVLLVSPLPPALAVAAIICFFWGLAAVVKRRRFRSVCLAGGALAPAFCLASTLLLLADNFSYTVFRFGIVSIQAPPRLIFGVLLLIVVAACDVFLLNCIYRLARRDSLRRPIACAATALAASIICAAIGFFSGNHAGADVVFRTNEKRELPNILWVCIDGLNARNMSVYGYPRDTTPHLRELARECLVAENHFSNAGASGASFASQMTGKLPTETRLYYPPDILRGKAAFQHLPGMLRRLGYRGIDVSMRYYVDPIDLNMLDSFDSANRRSGADSRLVRWLAGVLDPDSCYFVSVMFNRVEQRLLHIFGARKMENTYADVSNTHLINKDEERIDEIIAFMNERGGPFFAHLHLLVTHGPLFRPVEKPFVHGVAQLNRWMRNYYDSAIFDADESIQRLVDDLKAKGILDKTIVIVNSDHPEGYALPYRVPLLIRFPRGEHAGRIGANTQNLDIAATLVDYLGLKQPDWLGGSSLIARLDPFRILFSVRVKNEAAEPTKEHPGWWKLNESLAGPPFYGLGTLNAVAGNRYYELDVRSGTIGYCAVPGYAAALDTADAPTTRTIEQALIGHLAANSMSIAKPLTFKPIHSPYSAVIEDGIDVKEVDARKYPAPYVPRNQRRKRSDVRFY